MGVRSGESVNKENIFSDQLWFSVDTINSNGASKEVSVWAIPSNSKTHLISVDFLSDLLDGKVEYSNNENSSTSDFFLFKINFGGTVYLEDTVHVQVVHSY